MLAELVAGVSLQEIQVKSLGYTPKTYPAPGVNFKKRQNIHEFEGVAIAMIQNETEK